MMLPSIRIGKAEPPHTYLGVARAIAPAVEALAAAIPAPIPLCLLGAHQAECALKALLSTNGDDSELKKANVRHDLVGLWNRVAARGVPVPMPPPDWLQRLSELHDRPFFLRYSTGVHGVVTPNPQDVANGLRNLMALVEKSL